MSITVKFFAFTSRHPIIRGMLSYGTIWPTSCLIQQTIDGKRWETYDWKQMLRFSLYGSLFTAPTLYAWVRLSTKLWPEKTLKVAVTKAIVEQMTYGPAALMCFFVGMNLLEGGTASESVEEAKTKFWPTYKVALCFWPFVQTINFYFVPEKNRVPVVSCCSLLWCCFLSYMKQLEMERLSQQQNKSVIS